MSAFASHCSTCANSDIDAAIDNCFTADAETIKIGDTQGFLCGNMPKRATYPSPIYIFHDGYIYRFLGYGPEMPSYEIYNQIISTFKFTK